MLILALLCLGFLLLAIEFLVVPGFTVFGILGIITLASGVYLSFLHFTSGVAILILGLSFILTAAFVIWFFKKGIDSGFSLRDRQTLSEGFKAFRKDYTIYLHKEGEANSSLRPAGTVIIDNVKLDAVSQGDYIEAGEKIRVHRVEGTKLIVVKI